MITGMRLWFGPSKHSDVWHWLGRLALVIITVIMVMGLTGCKENFTGMLNPKGIIAYHERKLFFDTLALMLIVVLPVIVMSFVFLFHYQASHRVKEYKPDWSHSFFLESIWWTIPCVIVTILAVLTWKKTHELDPYKPIASVTTPPMVIQAIALPWNWLFIYPEQNIATLNYLVIPVNTQVDFWLTTDNVAMSAFFIPQLGSQLYAMAGMRTRLHLVGNEITHMEGMNTQYNGDGFSDMHFPVHVVSESDMATWVKSIKKSPKALTADAYQQLLIPANASKAEFYNKVQPNLFNNVINVYMNTYGNQHPRNAIAKYNKG